MTYVIIGLGIVLLLVLLLPRRHAQPQPQPQGATCSAARNWDEEYSYLYYINRRGELTYDSDVCRGCIENSAETLARQGYTVTEVVLGRKYSGDL